jgi:glycosyltransferase involved in cell wall biosynthesis
MKHNHDTGPATILYIHASDDLYGADIMLLQVVTGLDRDLFTPIVILPEDMQHVGLLNAELTARGIECMHLPIPIVRRRYLKPSGILPFFVSIVRGTLAVRRLARQRDVRLIHGFTFAVVAAPLAAFVLGLPLVMHCHEILERPKALRKLLHLINVRRAERVICVSGATRQNILEDQPSAAERIQVIHNGLRPSAPSGRTVAELRAQLGVPQGKPLVGMIGRISPWKGQEVFLGAAAMVVAENPDCHFISIGGVFDNETQHLERLQQLHKQLKLENVATLHDFITDARDMLGAFDLFISPSTSPDPFPTVILEAMSAGVPVIASAHGGPLEMVVDGETGLLVPPSDATALAAAINALLRDPVRREQMAQAGRVRMREHFSLKPFLDRVQNVYKTVLSYQGEYSQV